jgi:hypothetical protein
MSVWMCPVIALLWPCDAAAHFPAKGSALNLGADGETRTLTTFATAPSRQRVYQFHHVGKVLRYDWIKLFADYLGISFALDSSALGAGATGAAGAFWSVLMFLITPVWACGVE